MRKAKCADPHPIFVFNVHSHKRLEYFEVTEIMPGLLGNELRPVSAVWAYLGRVHQSEVGRIEIGPNEEFFTDMIDLVNNALPARLNDF